MSQTAPTRPPGTALITGASRGIGAVYADRLARRGVDLILVARDGDRLKTLADSLTRDTGRRIDILAADLTVAADLARVEKRLADDERIDLVINNAGAGSGGASTIDMSDAGLDGIIGLNITAFTRVARAAAKAFVQRGGGTLVNLSSVLALHLLGNAAAYSGSKAYVLQFSRVLQLEVAAAGVAVQIVLPGAVNTEIWSASGIDVDTLPAGTVMSADDLVDAALAGLDLGEHITLPSVPDIGDWDRFESARQVLTQTLSRQFPAARYRIR